MAQFTFPKRFSSYLITQALGAFNDNLFKMLLQLFVVQMLLTEQTEKIISQANLVFTLPFVLFSPWAGYLADRYPKAVVMRYVKLAEIGIMVIGFWAFYTGSLALMLTTLFLMATQSSFFGPAKYGYLPEVCRQRDISAANGWVGMTTFLAIILGTAAGGILVALHQKDISGIAIYCIAIAMIGWLAALRIAPTAPAAVSTRFPGNPLSAAWRELKFLKQRKPLFLAALANSYFWMVGLIFQTNILIYGDNMLGESSGSSIRLALLPALMGVGIAAGSMLAKRWSGKKVELGLVPLGGLGISLAGFGLLFATGNYYLACAILFLAGICGGLYYVPLYAYLQFYAEEGQKGRIMAAAGLLNGLALVLGTLLHRLLAVEFNLPPETIFAVMAISTLGAVAIICRIIPEFFIRFCIWLLTHTFFRIRIIGVENVPLRGPVLLAPNHVSYIDAFLIGATMQRFIRFIMLRKFYDIPVINKFLRLMKAIPIDPQSGRESVQQSLLLAREELQQQHAVCIFPEGKLTRDGQMNEFRTGCETIMAGLSCPIIPVYIHNLWGSIFSWEGGKVIWKRPHKRKQPITICFGKPLAADSSATDIEDAVRHLAQRCAA